MADNLKHRMIHALAWTSIDRFGQQAVQFIIGIVLARLLSPSDYGLIGMLMIFIAVSSIMVDGGFGQALIRKEKPTQIDFSTIFWLNLFMSIVLYFSLFFSAPFIAIFFHQPQLVNISRLLFLSIIFFALYFVQYVIIVKQVAYKSLAKVNISSTIISGGLGIYLAFTGFGIWALVAQQLSYHLFRLILFYIIRHWRPSFVFSFSIIKEYWSFSIHLLETALLNVIFNNIYLVLIGKFYPLKQVGYYSQANKLSETINFTSQQILQSSTFPLLVQIQNQEERYRRIYRRITEIISLFVFPILFTLIIISKPLIITLLSEKWIDSILLFQLLCVANLFTPIFGLNTSVLNSKGASKKNLHLELIRKILIVISIILCFSFGIVSMLIGFIFANFIAYIVSMFFIEEAIAYKPKQQFYDILPSLSVSIIVSVFLFFLQNILPNNNLILLITLSVVAFIIYIVLFYIFKKELFMKILLKIRNIIFRGK